MSKAYGVWHRIGLDAWNIARPALFIVDKAGTIRYSFVARSQDEFPAHDEILRELQRVSDEGLKGSERGGDPSPPRPGPI